MKGSRTPTKLLKLKGTYEPGKHGQRIDDTLPMLTPDSIIDVPNSLTDENIKSLWKSTTQRLLLWQILSDVDLINLEKAFVILQEIQRIEIVLQNTPVTNDSYDGVWKKYLKGVTNFNALVGKYGFTPSDRAKLKLTAINITKEETILDKIKRNS